MDIVQINDDFVFDPTHHSSISIVNSALKIYKEGYSRALDLTEEHKLFLDANIYLGYYGMSLKEKRALLEFIQKNKHRIIITNEIEKEILRNRLNVINKDFFTPLKDISSDYSKMNNDILVSMKRYVESKKKILSHDYKNIWNEVNEFREKVSDLVELYGSLSERIDTEINKTVNDYKNIAITDHMLDMIEDIIVIDELSNEERNFLKNTYETYLTNYKNAKSSHKDSLAFPGCGEKKEHPYGDFIILHEILKFMKTNNCHAVFITNDISKEDWIKKDRSPFIQYIEEAYRLTQHSLYVFDAKPIIKVNFENIYAENIDYSELNQMKDDIEHLMVVIFDYASDVFYNYLEPERVDRSLASTTIINKMANKYNVIDRNDLFAFMGANRMLVKAYESNDGKLDISVTRAKATLKKLEAMETKIYDEYVKCEARGQYWN